MVLRSPRERRQSLAVLIAAVVAVQAIALGNALGAGDGTTGIIVRLADPPVPRYRGGVRGLAATTVEHGKRLDSRSPAVARYRAFLAGKQDTFVAAAMRATSGAQVLHRYQLAL